MLAENVIPIGLAYAYLKITTQKLNSDEVEKSPATGERKRIQKNLK